MGSVYTYPCRTEGGPTSEVKHRVGRQLSKVNKQTKNSFSKTIKTESSYSSTE